MTRPLAVLAVLAVLAASPFGAVAQEATPAASPAAVCDVEPRSPDELQALSGTPAVAERSPEAIAELPEGEPVDAETVAVLETTLRLARACAEAGDLPRLLALYTDRYIVAQVLPAEATPIVPGEAPAEAETLPAGTPPATAEPAVAEARLLPDGRVAARVVTGERTEIVFFRYDEERQIWRIDAVAPVAAAEETPADEAAPPPAVAAALADAANQLGVAQDDLTVVTVEAREWSDASLGCPKPGEFYAQVITPGYLIVIQGAGQELEYHGDEQGNVVLCEEPAD